MTYTQTELNEIKLKAHSEKNEVILNLFEHITNSQSVLKVEAERDKALEEARDYREQTVSLELDLHELREQTVSLELDLHELREQTVSLELDLHELKAKLHGLS
jgi:chromosome segregation ATPase